MPSSEREFWAVELLGDEHAIACWEQNLKEEGDRCAYVIRHPRSTLPLLRSSDFDIMTNAAQVRARSRTLVDELNGALRAFFGCDRVCGGNVAEARSDGLLNRTLFGETAVFETRFFPVAISISGSRGPLLRPSQIQRWVHAASKNDVASQLLTHFGKGRDWFDLYKAYECMRSLAKRDKDYARISFVPHDPEFTRFRRTANGFRHAADHEGKSHPPKKPMTISEADAFIEARLKEAMDHFSD